MATEHSAMTAVVPFHAAPSRCWRAPLLSRPLRMGAAAFVAASHAFVIVAVVMFAHLLDVLNASFHMRNDLIQLGAGLLDFFPIVKAVCYGAAIIHGVLFFHTMRSLVRYTTRVPRKVFTTTSRFMSAVETEDSHHSIEGNATDAPLTSGGAFTARLGRGWTHVTRFFSTYPAEIAQVRMLVEIALQTFQAHKMSWLVATVWLNRLLAFVIVTNCWFAPIVYVVLRHRSLYVKQVARLTIDTLLDIVYSFGMPTAILYPYWRDYLPASQAFPFDFYVDDTWIAVAAAETRQVFVSSWLDLVSKTLPWFFLSYRLQLVRHLVSTRRRMTSNVAKSRVAWVLDGVLVMWGFAIVAIHSQTAWVANSAVMRGCLVEMRPWLSTEYTCTVAELSCSQRGITGGREDIARALAETDTTKIQGVIFSHCPLLEMPATIQSLSSVTTFKFYNTTIVDWPTVAALTQRTNPVAQQFFAVRTNFTVFPEGLLAVDFPTRMRDVKFIATNLSTLPLEFAYAWHSTNYLAVDLNPLMHEVPDAIAKLPNLMYLTMSGNAIVHIPDDFLLNLTVAVLQLAHNPLSVIPSHLGHTEALIIANTNVSDLPNAWLATKDDFSLGVFAIQAASTPLCDSLQKRSIVNSGSVASVNFDVGRFHVFCEDIAVAVITVLYPIEAEDVRRQANRFALSS